MHGPFPYHSSTSPSLATLPSMSGPKMMTNLLPQAQLGWTPWGYWPLLLSPWPLPQSMPTLEPSCCLPSIGDYCMVTHLTNHIPGPQHGWWHAIGRYPLPVHYSGGTGPGRVAKVTLRCVNALLTSLLEGSRDRCAPVLGILPHISLSSVFIHHCPARFQRSVCNMMLYLCSLEQVDLQWMVVHHLHLVCYLRVELVIDVEVWELQVVCVCTVNINIRTVLQKFH